MSAGMVYSRWQISAGIGAGAADEVPAATVSACCLIAQESKSAHLNFYVIDETCYLDVVKFIQTFSKFFTAQSQTQSGTLQ